MKKTVYAYNLKAINSNDKYFKNVESFERDLCAVVQGLCEQDKVTRRKDLQSDKKIIYISSYKYDNKHKILFLQFISAKYDFVRTVVDTDTLTEKKNLQKGKKDGEEEYNHMAIKFKDNNTAVCLYESNYYGIGFTKVVKYLEYFSKKYHTNKNDSIRYNIVHKNIVSKDFLEALQRVERIKMVTLEVESEAINVSEQKKFAKRADLSQTADIVLKPSAKGSSILSDTVKDFYKMYNDKNTSILSVTVDAENENKDPIKFDTESMKQKDIVEVDTNSRGEVESTSIYRRFEEILEFY